MLIRTLARTLACVVALGGGARGDLTSISPAGTGGPGGTITFSQIDPSDSTSANVNTDFTAASSIPLAAGLSGTSPVAIYGDAVNDTGMTLYAFTATILSGNATFLDPDGIYDPYGTYTDAMGFGVSIVDSGRTAIFSGGSIAAGDSLFTSLGIGVTDASVPLEISLSVSVPEPPSCALLACSVAVIGVVRAARRRGRCPALAGLAGLALVAICSKPAGAQTPAVAPAYRGNFRLAAAGLTPGQPTQLAFGPDGALYAMTADLGALRFGYDPATGSLGASAAATAASSPGIGIAFHGAEMYLSCFDGTIRKLTDPDGNGVWGESGELDVAIVTGLPQGDHNTDQIQVVGDTLYVGIGRRTINGHLGAYTSGTLDDLGGKGFFSGGLGRTYGDSAYNGTIAWIQDLTRVVNQPGAANAWTTRPPAFSQALIQHDSGPFTSADPSRLVVHSAGTRNPFGLCVDAAGALWFTNNFNRTATLGNGQAGPGLRGDQLDADFSKDVQDQLFRAVPGADYGYTDANWRGVNPMLTPTAPGYSRATSTTFDNLFNKGPYTIHDPANPDGLGPGASADGCAFSYAPLLPADLRGDVFIARYNGTITETGGLRRPLTYSDLVAVQVATGAVRRVASGFNSPLAVLADDANNRLLIADYGARVIYSLQAVGP